MQADKDFGDGQRHLGVHGEIAGRLSFGVGVGPVGRGADSAHLAGDCGARFLLPAPDALEKGLASEVVACLAFGL